MNLYKTINRLKQYQVIRQIQRDEAGKQESARAIPKACVFEAATRAPADKFSDLKKQSQFAAAHLVAKPLMKEDYSNSPASGDENKAKQACPFSKFRAGSEQRRMEPISHSSAG
jgi:hypothetical protein